jgi:gamma-glutamylcyclotransferase (GGCT)/AIG2-like uncharacterized protein YtfP
MNETILKSVTGKRFRSKNAILYGYGRYRVRDEMYPGIIPEEGSSVEGKVYFDIDDIFWSRLDRFEGEYYERRVVEVRIDKDKQVVAFTYVIREKYKNILSGEQWDIQRFEREEIGNFLRKNV